MGASQSNQYWLTYLFGGGGAHHVFGSSVVLGSYPQYELAVHHANTFLKFFACNGNGSGRDGGGIGDYGGGGVGGVSDCVGG